MKNIKLVIIVNVIAVFIVMTFFVLAQVNKLPFSLYSNNAYSYFGIPFYYGVLYKLGIILWIIIITICFFVFNVIKSQNEKIKSIKKFLFVSGLFFTFLLTDDFFSLHGYVIPRFLHIPQSILLPIYGLFSILFLFFFANTIIKTDYFFLVLGLLLLGISAAVDILTYFNILNFSSRYLFDDGSKFIGSYNLSIYYYLLGRSVLSKN